MKASYIRCPFALQFVHRRVKMETKGVRYLVRTCCRNESELWNWEWMGGLVGWGADVSTGGPES